MLANEVGFAQSEGWMCLAKVDESTVIVEYLRISLEVIPVEVIDTIRLIIRVMHPFLVAKHLLTREHERHTL